VERPPYRLLVFARIAVVRASRAGLGEAVAQFLRYPPHVAGEGRGEEPAPRSHRFPTSRMRLCNSLRRRAWASPPYRPPAVGFCQNCGCKGPCRAGTWLRPKAAMAAPTNRSLATCPRRKGTQAAGFGKPAPQTLRNDVPARQRWPPTRNHSRGRLCHTPSVVWKVQRTIRATTAGGGCATLRA
jgi:hypothetical protein